MSIKNTILIKLDDKIFVIPDRNTMNLISVFSKYENINDIEDNYLTIKLISCYFNNFVNKIKNNNIK